MSSTSKGNELRENMSIRAGYSVLSSQAVVASVLFIGSISLMLFVNNLMARYSFEPAIVDFERAWVYNWEHHLDTFDTQILTMNFLAIIFSVMLLIMSIAITTEKVKSRSYLVVPVKALMFFGFLTSLTAYVLQRISVSLFFSEDLQSFTILVNLTKQGVLFETLTLLLIAIILIICSFIYVDSILSFKKPAVYLASSGFLFAFISGAQSNFLFSKLYSIEYEVFRTRLASGIVFSQLSELFLIFALCIGILGLMRDEKASMIALTTLSMLTLVVTAFYKSLILILFNLVEDYPTTERYEALYKRDPILEAIVTTLIILFIILNMGLVVKPGIRDVKRAEEIKDERKYEDVPEKIHEPVKIVEEDIKKREAAPKKIYEPAKIVEEDVEKREAVEPIIIQLCPKCNFEISPTNKFCPECGVKIAQSEKRGDKK